MGIQKTIELTKKATGDILFFSTSKNKIRNIVSILNNSEMPSNWCALPYYSELGTKWLDLFGSVGNTKINLDMNRRDIFLMINNLEYRKVSPTLYTRYVIVATNVAEASITIRTLKYVIETGWQVSVSYDPFLGVTTNKITEITEASRKQRRGRVGRTQAGTVYYMYEKDARKNVKKIYPITQKIDELIYTLSRLLYDGFTNIDGVETPDKKVGNDELLKLNIVFAGNPMLRNIIIEPDEINYRRYKTGYDLKTIYDFNGEFYLIHPFENYVKREEFSGDIIEFSTKNKNKYIEQFDALFKLRLIAITDDNNFIKTKVFKELENLFKEVKAKLGNSVTYTQLWTYVLGYRYNFIEEVCWINTVIESGSIKTLSQMITTKNNIEIPDSKMLIEKFGDTGSDLNVYVNIFKKIKLILPKLIEFSAGELNIQINKTKNETILDIDDYNYVRNIDTKDRTQLNSLIIYKNTKDINYARVEAFCDYYGLNYKNIHEYIKSYLSKMAITNIIGKWVNKNNNLIPYFSEIRDIPFIYISAYSNLNNIADMKDIRNTAKDPLSIVTGVYIHSIKKELNQNREIMMHMSTFNPSIHTKAIIPAFIFPLTNDTLIWKDIYLYYENISPRILEEYLLPEDNKEDIKKDKVFNQQLLSLFRLFRSRL